MQWIIIIIAMIAAIPTYGVSILILIVILPYLSEHSRRKIMPQLIRKSMFSGGSYIEDNVFYEAAERYAQDSNNVIYSTHDIISFNHLVHNKKVIVTFSKILFSSGVKVDTEYA